MVFYFHSINLSPNFSITVLVMWRNRKVSSTAFLLINLAITDTLTLLGFWIIQTLRTMDRTLNTTTGKYSQVNAHWCKFVWDRSTCRQSACSKALRRHYYKRPDSIKSNFVCTKVTQIWRSYLPKMCSLVQFKTVTSGYLSALKHSCVDGVLACQQVLVMETKANFLFWHTCASNNYIQALLFSLQELLGSMRFSELINSISLIASFWIQLGLLCFFQWTDTSGKLFVLFLILSLSTPWTQTSQGFYLGLCRNSVV